MSNKLGSPNSSAFGFSGMQSKKLLTLGSDKEENDKKNKRKKRGGKRIVPLRGGKKERIASMESNKTLNEDSIKIDVNRKRNSGYLNLRVIAIINFSTHKASKLESLTSKGLIQK
jgi:hypothetical protein